MNQLRQLMLEELHRRNFAATTIRTYLHGVEHFSRYFRRRPDQLGPEDIRKYQAALFTQFKFSPNTVILRLASLRFFYIHVLKRGWSIAETPYPKKVRHLPGVLSQEEVAQLIDAADTPFHRILLMTVVYSKPPFGGPEHVLRYLGAYTHRVAISNSRLVGLSDGDVTFRWRDSAHGNKKRLMTLPVDEFLRRFVLHLLPPGFVRIRNFGFLANRNRATLLPLCFQLLGGVGKMPASVASPSADQNYSLWSCPVCGRTMLVVERLSATQLLLRSPPQPDRCAA